MIPSDGNLVWVRLGLQPVDLGLDLGRCASIGKIPSVDKDIAGGNGEFLSVGIGDADDTDRIGIGRVSGAAER